MRTLHHYNPDNFPSVSPEQIEEIKALENVKDSEIDLSDAPELTKEAFGHATFYYSQSLRMAKKPIHTNIDEDNLRWLQKDGKGYQKRLNNVLRWARLNGCPISQL